MFNEDLLTWYKEPKFKGQYMDLVPPPDIINKKEEYKVEEVQGHQNKAKVHNSWCIRKSMEINMING